MKYVTDYDTPVGGYAIGHGEFMPSDPAKQKNYHAWSNGCRIGCFSSSMTVTKEKLSKEVAKRLIEKRVELCAILSKVQQAIEFSESRNPNWLDNFIDRSKFS